MLTWFAVFAGLKRGFSLAGTLDVYSLLYIALGVGVGMCWWWVESVLSLLLVLTVSVTIVANIITTGCSLLS